MKLEAVIFDMDGTLLDTQRETFNAWNAVGEKQGLSLVGNTVLSVCGMNEKGWGKALIEKYPGFDLVKFKADVAEHERLQSEIRPKPGMFELLAFLKEKSLKIGVASGTDPKIIKKNLTCVGALDFFETLTGGDEVENGKPAPDVFLLAAERLGVAPENCLIFEDSSNGILAGRNAGMTCIGVPDMTAFTEEAQAVCYAVVPRLDHAIPLLDALCATDHNKKEA